MKSFAILISLLSLCLLYQPADGAMYQSDLGYSIDVPESWTVLSKGNGKEKPEIVQAAMDKAKDDKGLSAIPENVLSQVKELLIGEKIDYYYSPKPRFTISVYKGSGNLPSSLDKVEDLCRSLKEEFDNQSNKKIKLHQCDVRDMNGHNAIHLVADDYRKDKKYIQYQIQRNKDEVLFITANSMEREFDEMSEDFDAIVRSLKIE